MNMLNTDLPIKNTILPVKNYNQTADFYAFMENLRPQRECNNWKQDWVNFIRNEHKK